MGKKKKRKSKNKNKKPFSLFFWMAVILVIALVFLLKYKPIKDNLASFSNKNNTGTLIEQVEKKTKDKNTEKTTNVVKEVDEISEPKEDIINISIIPSEKKKPPSNKKEVEMPKITNEKSYIANIYYLSVNDDAEINLKKVEKEIKYVSTPLLNTIETMISGISSEEVTSGLMNFIPKDTKLLSATIKNKTAYLNFSKEFLVDQFGRDGAKAKLMQIVYTATDFPTIDDVQFLVEGEIRNYLNAEGVNIGKPLSRSSF